MDLIILICASPAPDPILDKQTNLPILSASSHHCEHEFMLLQTKHLLSVLQQGIDLSYMLNECAMKLETIQRPDMSMYL